MQEGAMTPSRKLSRRSFLGRVAGGVVLGGGSLALLSGPAAAFQPRRTVTDADSGQTSDPPSLGRGRRIARCSDTDSGPNSDPGLHGRGSGHTDSDTGPNSDPANCGRR
jgi:hypothetical protein